SRWDAVRKSVDVLVPGAVEVAAEQHVVVDTLLLTLAEVWPLLLPDDDPTGEVDERETHQSLQRAGISSGEQENQVVDPCLPPLYRRQHVHGVGFARNVRHRVISRNS